MRMAVELVDMQWNARGHYMTDKSVRDIHGKNVDVYDVEHNIARGWSVVVLALHSKHPCSSPPQSSYVSKGRFLSVLAMFYPLPYRTQRHTKVRTIFPGEESARRIERINFI